MSSYLNFYLKDKSGGFNLLNSFSRNNAIYQYGDEYAPYDAGNALTPSLCREIVNNIEDELAKEEKCVKSYEERRDSIIAMNNSVEEKIEALNDLRAYMSEIEEITAELRFAESFYRTLLDILQNCKWSNGISKAEDYIYMGVEWYPDYEEEV